mmetsp:Transcript_108500/g.312560  ORF Transcript_108500/g.312560 Transcript_108500/m.312560 type:complete len:589 (-) Transcript_108500:171-1937(-)
MPGGPGGNRGCGCGCHQRAPSNCCSVGMLRRLPGAAFIHPRCRIQRLRYQRRRRGPRARAIAVAVGRPLLTEDSRLDPAYSRAHTLQRTQPQRLTGLFRDRCCRCRCDGQVRLAGIRVDRRGTGAAADLVSEAYIHEHDCHAAFAFKRARRHGHLFPGTYALKSAAAACGTCVCPGATTGSGAARVASAAASSMSLWAEVVAARGGCPGDAASHGVPARAGGAATVQPTEPTVSQILDSVAFAGGFARRPPSGGSVPIEDAQCRAVSRRSDHPHGRGLLPSPQRPRRRHSQSDPKNGRVGSVGRRHRRGCRGGSSSIASAVGGLGFVASVCGPVGGFRLHGNDGRLACSRRPAFRARNTDAGTHCCSKRAVRVGGGDRRRLASPRFACHLGRAAAPVHHWSPATALRCDGRVAAAVARGFPVHAWTAGAGLAIVLADAHRHHRGGGPRSRADGLCGRDAARVDSSQRLFDARRSEPSRCPDRPSRRRKQLITGKIRWPGATDLCVRQLLAFAGGIARHRRPPEVHRRASDVCAPAMVEADSWSHGPLRMRVLATELRESPPLALPRGSVCPSLRDSVSPLKGAGDGNR